MIKWLDDPPCEEERFLIELAAQALPDMEVQATRSSYPHREYAGLILKIKGQRMISLERYGNKIVVWPKSIFPRNEFCLPDPRSIESITKAIRDEMCKS